MLISYNTLLISSLSHIKHTFFGAKDISQLYPPKHYLRFQWEKDTQPLPANKNNILKYTQYVIHFTLYILKTSDI